ncbi:MAG: hypothetical protein MZW92_18830 [Comamonadaceae bacterium]|nr:hypothetical protein [Comamonadaceae bacterium]
MADRKALAQLFGPGRGVLGTLGQGIRTSCSERVRCCTPVSASCRRCTTWRRSRRPTIGCTHLVKSAGSDWDGEMLAQTAKLILAERQSRERAARISSILTDGAAGL